MRVIRHERLTVVDPVVGAGYWWGEGTVRELRVDGNGFHCDTGGSCRVRRAIKTDKVGKDHLSRALYHLHSHHCRFVIR